MERRRRTARRPVPGGLNTRDLSTSGSEALPELPNIEQLVSDQGQITIGAIYPMRCVAIANDGHNSLAMLIRRDEETLTQLLTRLDAAIAKAYNENKFTDEVNVPLPRSITSHRR